MRCLLVALVAISMATALLLGCGSSVPGSPPNDDEGGSITTFFDGLDQVARDVANAMSDVFALAEAGIRSVTSRWPGWASDIVTAKNDDTQAVIASKTLTRANPSATFNKIAPGTPVKVYAPLYAVNPPTGASYITTGASPRVVIEAGQNKSAPITLIATKAVLTVQAPLDGATVNDDNVVVKVKVFDLGGGQPTVVLTDNGATVSATPTVTGDTLTGYTFSWVMTQPDGAHVMVLTSTTTSHLSASNSGVSSTSWSYTVDTTGGVNVGITSVGGGK